VLARFIAATSDTVAAGAATSEIVINKRYGHSFLQAITVYCVLADVSLRQR
jgi:hypothetical protein